MDLSGVIFVVLAVVWAVYLIPKALKHNDEAARSRSVDRFSDETRVVARREPVSRRDARLVVSPAASVPVKVEASGPVKDEAPVAARVGPAVPSVRAVQVGRADGRRTAGKVAARRRRRILAFLLLLVAATAVAAYLGHLPSWSAAVPGGLALVFLLLCRTQVRRRRSRPRRLPAEPARRPAYVAPPTVELEAADAEALAAGEQALVAEQAATAPVEEPVRPLAEPQPERVQVTEAVGATVPGTGSGALWDPVPVTLPTYVTKPKARRTVRTIDLGEAGTWTSGRTAEDAEIAARATDPQAAEGQSPKAGQRAVGT